MIGSRSLVEEKTELTGKNSGGGIPPAKAIIPGRVAY